MFTETTGAAPQDGEVTGEDTQQNGTPGEQARDAQDENIGKLNMEWKDKAANWNKIETLMSAYGVSSIDELNERLARSPAVQGESEPEDEDPYKEVDFSEVKKWAKKGDATSVLALKAYEEAQKLKAENQRLVRGVEDAFVARDIKDERMRQRILNHFNNNRHRFADLRGAAAEIRAADLEADNKRLQEQLARHQKNGVNPNAPSTHVPDAPPGKTNDTKKMKQSEFRAEVERLRTEGNHEASMALQRKRRLFEIEILPG